MFSFLDPITRSLSEPCISTDADSILHLDSTAQPLFVPTVFTLRWWEGTMFQSFREGGLGSLSVTKRARHEV